MSTKSDPIYKSGHPDSDQDVCWIASKMLWIHYLVGVSHFAECRENRLATVCMRYANKSSKIPYSQL